MREYTLYVRGSAPVTFIDPDPAMIRRFKKAIATPSNPIKRLVRVK